MKSIPSHLPPLPVGTVFLGLGGSFKLLPGSAYFKSYTFYKNDHQWSGLESNAGDGSRTYYAAPADSEIVRLNAPKSVDLSSCVVGQKLRCRDGSFYTFEGSCVRGGHICRIALIDNPKHYRSVYTSTGRGNEVGGIDCDCDVLEILPLEQQASPAPEIAKPPAAPRSPRELYLEGAKLADFKAGEWVKVLFAVPTEAGWPGTWVEDMNAFVGETHEVVTPAVTAPDARYPSGNVGIKNKKGVRWFFPWFCLQRAESPKPPTPKKPEPVSIKLDDSFTAVIDNALTVKVGCQTFEVQKLKELETSMGPASRTLALNSSYVAQFTAPAVDHCVVNGTKIAADTLRQIIKAAEVFAAPAAQATELAAKVRRFTHAQIKWDYHMEFKPDGTVTMIKDDKDKKRTVMTHFYKIYEAERMVAQGIWKEIP